MKFSNSNLPKLKNRQKCQKRGLWMRWHKSTKFSEMATWQMFWIIISNCPSNQAWCRKNSNQWSLGEVKIFQNSTKKGTTFRIPNLNPTPKKDLCLGACKIIMQWIIEVNRRNSPKIWTNPKTIPSSFLSRTSKLGTHSQRIWMLKVRIEWSKPRIL